MPLLKGLHLTLILASTSPYRKELLERLKIPFDCIASEVDEDSYKEKITDPATLTTRLALEKADSVFKIYPQSTVIGGDQVSVINGQILGKPYTFEGACSQLTLLSGKTHKLLTSVCIMSPNQDAIQWTNITSLAMRPLTRAEIEDYVKSDDPLNCAGSYKIEALGISLFESIQTEDFTAITGLPLMQLGHHLRQI